MTGVLLVENSAVFRAALRSVLQKLGFSVIVPPQHLRMAGEQAMVILVDAITSSEDLQQLELLVREYSRVGPVLLLAREDHVEQVVAGLRGGAIGFLKQTASPRDLRAAIRAVCAGRTWCDADLLRQAAKYLPSIPQLRKARLTQREQEVLNRVRRGESNKEVAQQLGVTEQSVKVYVSNLLRKTGATNRHELAYLLTVAPLKP
jgi:two-component system nitrate/nitrite response regulator NarL